MPRVRACSRFANRLTRAVLFTLLAALSTVAPVSAALAPGTQVNIAINGPGGSRSVQSAVASDGTVSANFPINSFGNYTYSISGQPPMTGSLTVDAAPKACAAGGLAPDTSCAGVTHTPLPGSPGSPSYITIGAKFAPVAAAPTATPISTPVPTAVATPVPQPTATQSAAKTGGDGIPWVWILLGVIAVAVLGAVALFVRQRTAAPVPPPPHTCSNAAAEVAAAEANLASAHAKGDTHYRKEYGDLSLGNAVSATEFSQSQEDFEEAIARETRWAEERLARARDSLRRCQAGGPDLPDGFQPPPPGPGTGPDFNPTPPPAGEPDADEAATRTEIK